VTYHTWRCQKHRIPAIGDSVKLGRSSSRSVVSIETPIALVDDYFMTPRIPAGSVVVPAVDVVDHHLAISLAIPVLPVAVSEAFDSHHSRSVTLDNHSPHRRTVAGVSMVYRYSSGNRTAANRNLCRNALSVKRGCHQRQTCYQRPCTSAGLHIVLDWGMGEPQSSQGARVVPAPKWLSHMVEGDGSGPKCL
jgi:hypothetical protein